MLRNAYAYGTPELQDCLIQFDMADDATLVDVKQFRMLSPDSFVWKLRLMDGIYYLYAADYVSSFDDIVKQVATFTNGQKGHFVRVLEPKPFEDLIAVKNANIYPMPHDYESKMSEYTAESGFDLAFLFKVDELNEQDEEDL